MFICYVIILYTTNAVYGSSLPPVVCWRVHVLLCFCVCLCIVVSTILLFLVVLAFCVVLCCVVFCLFFLFLSSSRVLWTHWYLFLWIVHYWLPLRFSLTFIFTSLYLTLNLNKMVLPYFNACTNLRFTVSYAFVYIRHIASQMHIINILIYSVTNLY
jgi:hypothetical protein